MRFELYCIQPYFNEGQPEFFVFPASTGIHFDLTAITLSNFVVFSTFEGRTECRMIPDSFFSLFEDAAVLTFIDNPEFYKIYFHDSNGNSLNIGDHVYFFDNQALLNFLEIDCLSSSSSTDLPSLNGNGCEFKDGESVTAVGRGDIIFTIVRSFYSIYADNAYVVIYDLESEHGLKLSCPESLVARYVDPVIIP